MVRHLLPEIRVVIQDRLPLVRLGVTRMLDGDDRILVVADVLDGPELVSACVLHAPDVAICGFNEPGVDKTVAACLEARPKQRMLGLHLGRASDHQAHAEALGVTLLSYASSESEIRAAVRGRPVRPLPPEVEHRKTATWPVTSIERDLLRMLDEGMTSTAAARSLGLDQAQTARALMGARQAFGTSSLRVAVRRARTAGLFARSVPAGRP